MTHMLNHPTKLPLVDDDPSMVRLLTKIIERQFEDEIELASLTDPKEARKQIEGQAVGILVTDLEMPGEDESRVSPEGNDEVAHEVAR